jgi:hypothetical protein
LRGYYDALRPYTESGGYINFMQDDDLGKVPDNFRHNYDRLVQVKRTHDPHNLFHLNRKRRAVAPERRPAAMQSQADRDPKPMVGRCCGHPLPREEIAVPV